MTSDSNTLSATKLAAFSTPAFVLSIMLAPMLSVIPAIYAKYTTVSLAAIGTILLLGRLFDAITDPLIGYLSDRFDTRLGKRKPWMIAGTPLAMIAIIFLFSPPETAGAGYFLVWMAMVFGAYTLISIPYNAWSVELSHDYHERSRIVTWRETFGFMGGVLLMASPLLLRPWTGNTEMGPQVVEIAGWSVAALLPIFVFIAIRFVPTGKPVETHRLRLRDFRKSMSVNKPFYRFTFTALVAGLGFSSWGAMLLIFMDAYLGIADKFIYVLLVAWTTRVVTAPIWIKLLKRFGKNRVWATCLALGALVSPAILLLEPGASAIKPLLIYACILGFIETGSVVGPAAIYGDIIDFDTLKTGSNKASSFYAIQGLILKTTSGFGAAVAFFLLSAFGFSVQGGNSEQQLTGLFWAIGILPPIMYFIAAATIWGFPLNARRQEIIRRRIESRAARG